MKSAPAHVQPDPWRRPVAACVLLPAEQTAREVAETFLKSLIDTIGAFVEGSPSAYIGIGTFQRGASLGERCRKSMRPESFCS